MRCTGCGKDVPFGGQVCPYCQRDKSSDQIGTVITGICLLIGGFIGGAIGGIGGALIGGFTFGLLGAMVSMAGGNKSTHKAPVVRIESDASFKSPPPKRVEAPKVFSAEERFRHLDDLKVKGLITDEEYASQRASIVTSI